MTYTSLDSASFILKQTIYPAQVVNMAHRSSDLWKMLNRCYVTLIILNTTIVFVLGPPVKQL